MNWKEIKEKYPKAIKLILSTDHSPVCLYNEFAPSRNFYDFFDENGLIIIIDYDYYDGDFLWKFDITFGTGTIYESGSMYNNRQDVEGPAFIKAFEILEEKLN